MHGIRAVIARLRGLSRRRRRPELDLDDPRLRTVVDAFDDTESASSALARSTRWDPDLPAVLRHHLVVSPQHEERVRAVLGEEGWTVRAGVPAPGSPETGADFHDTGDVPLIALRVQQLEGLHCSQASARMAGLAQRSGGRALGWDAQQLDAAN